MLKAMKKYNIIAGMLLGLMFFGFLILFFEIIPFRDFVSNRSDLSAISAIVKILLGSVELIFFVHIFEKKHIRNVLNFNNSKKALISGIPLLLCTVYLLLYIILTHRGFSQLHIRFVIIIIVQQIATGFWEELTFRGYFMQGLLDKYQYILKYRILCCFIVGFVFGAGHMIECSFWHEAIYRFITTGIMGISYASIFLYSGNLLIAMLIHTIYDIIANLYPYADEILHNPAKVVLDSLLYPMYGIILIFAIVIIVYPCIKNEKRNKNFMNNLSDSQEGIESIK